MPRTVMASSAEDGTDAARRELIDEPREEALADATETETVEPVDAPLEMPGRREGLTILPELDRIYTRMRQADHPAFIHSGLRTLAEQVENYAVGRTYPAFRDGLRAEVQSGLLTPEVADHWIHYYDPAGGSHPMPPGRPGVVTWTVGGSRHLTGDAADVVHMQLWWRAPAAFWDALREAAFAEGLQIGPPRNDLAHVQRP